MERVFPHWLAERWIVMALAASAAMLAAAHAFERFGGLPPCALCLRQREVYWAAIAIALGALLAGAVWRSGIIARISAALLGLAFLSGAAVAGYHAGVEWGFWPGPSTCTGSGEITAESILAALESARAVIPCDEAPWRMLGVSMAGYNTLISLGLAIFSVAAAVRAEQALSFEPEHD